MTDPADFDPTESALPGLDAPARGESSMKLAARRSITALEAAGYLDETHAVLCEQMLQLADAVDAGRRQGKASAVAMAATALLATYQLMVPESKGGDGGDEWHDLVADIRRSATTPRDTT